MDRLKLIERPKLMKRFKLIALRSMIRYGEIFAVINCLIEVPIVLIMHDSCMWPIVYVRNSAII